MQSWVSREVCHCQKLKARKSDTKGVRHMRTLTGDLNSQGQGCALKDWPSGD